MRPNPSVPHLLHELFGQGPIDKANMDSVQAAEFYQHAMFVSGEPGYAELDDLEWFLVDDYPVARLESKVSAAWFHGEIQKAWGPAAEDYTSMTLEAIREPIIVHDNGTSGFIWDGHHRVGATYSKAQPRIKAMVGIPKSLLLSQANMQETRVVDEHDHPLTVYHGTHAVFENFAANPRGIFFSEDAAAALSFTGIRKGTPSIKAAQLCIKRPWTMVRYGLDTPYSQMLDQSCQALSALGYDGIHCPDNKVWIAFSPDQVRTLTSPIPCDVRHANARSLEQAALIEYLLGAEVHLYHGTSPENAERLLADGSVSTAPVGANGGNKRLLYVTTDPLNALWFAEQSGCSTVLRVCVPAAHLRCDPEDGVHGTVAEELQAADRMGLPASLALSDALPASAFEIYTLKPAPTEEQQLSQAPCA